MIVGFIDDRRDNLDAWNAAMRGVCAERVDLVCFEAIEELIESLASGMKPDVMFVDFFINGRYGIEVVRILRDFCGDHVCIIAHSSMEQANEGMVACGANLAIPKVKGLHPSPTVIEAFADFESFAAMTRLSNSD